MNKDEIALLPKVELHVHLEGAIRPGMLMHLAAKNYVDLPPKTLEEFDKWYEFVDSLEGRAEQNIIHTEATYTAFTHYKMPEFLSKNRWTRSALLQTMRAVGME